MGARAVLDRICQTRKCAGRPLRCLARECSGGPDRTVFEGTVRVHTPTDSGGKRLSGLETSRWCRVGCRVSNLPLSLRGFAVGPLGPSE